MKQLTIKDDKESAIKKYDRSNLVFHRDFTFHQFNDSNKFRELSFKSKFLRLNDFSVPLKQFHNLKAKRENAKKKRQNY